MPITIGIPLGLFIILVGAVLFFATQHKRTALIVMGVGATIAFLTFILVLLAINSQM
jgi:uncharacterized membrane protein YccC